MYELGDIKINGKEYRIDIDSYKVKDLADFSPRASVPGGSIIQSELLLYQPLVMTDWRHGFGFVWHTDAMGYMRSEGNIDTRYPGIAMRSTAPVTRTDGSDTAKAGYVEFNNELYSWSSTGLRKMDYSTGVWSNVYTGSINFAFPTENWLFYCPTNGRIRKMSKTNVHSDTGVNTNSTDYSWLIIYRGFIYAGKRNKNEVYYAEEEDLSDLHGSPADDPNMIPVGAGGYPTIGAIFYAGYLYVLRKDGIWAIGEDRIARLVLDFSSEMSNSNFRARTVFNGYFYFNIGPKVYQWNGSRLVEQTPPRLNDVYPYQEIINVYAMTTANNFLYMTGTYVLGANYAHSLFSFDGVGWHKLNDFILGGSAITLPALYYAPVVRRLYVTNQSGTNQTYEIPLGDGIFPYPAFGTTGNHYLYTPRLDMGFRRIRKSMPSILVEGSNLNANRTIEVAYAIDGSTSFINWGTINTTGITELTNPGGNRTIEFNNIIFRLKFNTNSTANSPILEGLTVRFLLRPDVFYGYNFNIIAAQNYVYGNRQDTRTPVEIFNEIKQARDSKAPVEFIDIFGETHYGYISAVTQLASERHEVSDAGGIPNIEGRINVNLVEAR